MEASASETQSLICQKDDIAVAAESASDKENGVVVVVESGSIKSSECKTHNVTEEQNKNTLGAPGESEEFKAEKENSSEASQAAFQDVCGFNKIPEAVGQDGAGLSEQNTEPNHAKTNSEKDENSPEDTDPQVAVSGYLQIQNESNRRDEVGNEILEVQICTSLDNSKETNPSGSEQQKVIDSEQSNKDVSETKEICLGDGGIEGEVIKQEQILVPIISAEEDMNEAINESLSEKEPADASSTAEYICDECDKRFTHLSSKKRHMLKHRSGDIPPVVYQCFDCSKTFNYNSSLKRHLKLHTDEANGKEYTCKECSKAFMYATSLKRHLKTHTGKEIFPCPHCHRCFEYISSLKRHEKLHSVGKGFKCESCLKSFGYLSSLTRHQRIHQKCLSCDQCHRQFRFHKSYMKHIEEHSKGNGTDDLCKEDLDKDIHETECGDEDNDMDVDESTEAGENGDLLPKDTSSEVAHAIESVQMDSQATGEINATKEPGKVTNTLHGEVLDLQAAENHPFVKFVVSQNTLNMEQIQSLQAHQAPESGETDVATSSANVTFALVQADNNAVVENCTMVTEGQDFSDASVGGIVFVELDQNNKVTERHMEGLQASNLLQLLQAVEGFAVEQTINLDNNQQEANEGYVAVKEDSCNDEEKDES